MLNSAVIEPSARKVVAMTSSLDFIVGAIIALARVAERKYRVARPRRLSKDFAATTLAKLARRNSHGVKKITRQDLRDAAEKYKNWGKWGPDDEIGTLNYTRRTTSSRPRGWCAKAR